MSLTNQYVAGKASADELASALTDVKTPEEFYTRLSDSVERVMSAQFSNEFELAEKLVHLREAVFKSAESKQLELGTGFAGAGAISGLIGAMVFMYFNFEASGNSDYISSVFYGIGDLFKVAFGSIVGLVGGSALGAALGAVIVPRLSDGKRYEVEADRFFKKVSCSFYLK